MTLDSDGSGHQLTSLSSLATLFAGSNLTATNTTIDVQDNFLRNDGNDTTSGTITAAGFTTTGTWTFDLNLQMMVQQ